MNAPARRRWSLCAVVLLLSGGPPARAGDVAAVPDGSGSAAQSLATEIDRLIGDGACARDDECRVVGVGARACGGPEGYRAWSTRQTDAQRLEAVVHRQAAERRAELERLGMQSTCDIRPAPLATCRKAAEAPRGRCITVAPNLAN